MIAKTNSSVQKTIIQISDLHFNHDRLNGMPSPKERLDAVISHINTHSKDEKIIVVTGDLVSKPEDRLYRDLFKELEKFGCLVYAIPGNHDDTGLMEKEVENTNLVKLQASCQYGAWRLVFVDSSLPGKNLGSGKLTQKTFNELSGRLTSYEKEHVIVFIHHPPVLFGARWFKSICLEGRNEFNELIHSYHNVKAVIFGHAHTEFNCLWSGKLYICSPSAWCQFDHQDDEKLSYLDTAAGYNWYKINDDGSIIFGSNYVS